MNLYKDELTYHYKHPSNYGNLENPDFSIHGDNPLCGDSIHIEGNIEDGILKEIKFTGKGCILSLATASMLTEYVKGKEVEEIKKMKKGDILKLIKIELGPNRLRCALLPLETLQKGLNAK